MANYLNQCFTTSLESANLPCNNKLLINIILGFKLFSFFTALN